MSGRVLYQGRGRSGRQGRGGSCLGGAGSGGSCTGQGFRLHFHERRPQPRSCRNPAGGKLGRGSQPRAGKTTAERTPLSRDRARYPSGQTAEPRGPRRGSAVAPLPAPLILRGLSPGAAGVPRARSLSGGEGGSLDRSGWDTPF